MTHERFMQFAIALGERHLGRTWPNPSVGAVIVRDGQIVGVGITQPGGRPHAETEAIAAAGERARGATLYVSLEPCAHHGKTPPCTEAIIKAGITTCVIGCHDPFDQVNGEGIAQLKNANITVIENICKQEAAQAQRGFFSLIQKKSPFISLKLATSQDHKITTGDASKRWITGETSRAYGHLLRSRYDAILTGIGTVLADDPQMTCRLPGLEDCSPQRIVLDRGGRLLSHAKIQPAWVMNDADINTVVTKLGEKGITRLLVEAGQALSTSFLQSGLVDRIYWFTAPIVIGDGGMNVFSPNFSFSDRWKPLENLKLGNDTLQILEPA